MSQPQDYKKKFAISQSAIKEWVDYSPVQWYQRWILKQRKSKSSESLEFGNLLDTLLFTPHLYDSRFILSKVKKPSDNVCAVVKAVFDHIVALNENAATLNEENTGKEGFIPIPAKEFDLTASKDIVIKFCQELDYYKTQLERGFNEIVKHGTDYFSFLKEANGRIVITDEQLALANLLKQKLTDDPVSRPFFIPKKGCEVIFQKQIFADFPLDGFENLEFIALKGILDIIHINHKRKEIREVDLKYTNNAYQFTDAIKRFDYAMQHSFYDFLLNEWKKTAEKEKYKDYVVMPPLNVVIDDVDQIPYLYHYNTNDLMIKRLGIENTWIKGWEQILYEIAYHISLNDWTRPIEHVKNGFISVKIFNKK